MSSAQNLLVLSLGSLFWPKSILISYPDQTHATHHCLTEFHNLNSLIPILVPRDFFALIAKTVFMHKPEFDVVSHVLGRISFPFSCIVRSPEAHGCSPALKFHVIICVSIFNSGRTSFHIFQIYFRVRKMEQLFY